MTADGTVDLLSELGRRVRAARVLSGKKVPELATEIGCSVKTLYRIETGKADVSVRDVIALAEATGQPLDFFYGTTSPAEPNSASLSDPVPVVKSDEA